MRPIVVTLGIAFLTLTAGTLLAAEEVNGARTRPPANAEPTVERFIVKLRTSGALSTRAAAGNGESALAASDVNARQRVTALAARVNVAMKESHALGHGLHLLQVSPVARGEAMQDMLAHLRADADVEYAVPDRKVYIHAISDDPLATGQWYLAAAQPAAINAHGAWDITQGNDAITIADIDTGVRSDHPDLSGRLWPGFDFVTATTAANDGNGRDSDASDPGDNCNTDPSSWHGTRTSGIIGAATNNAVGVAGITWKGKILPVRVLGKCGGSNSDVLAGMLWAAGHHVDSVPDNTHPARVLNVSLGSEGVCDSASADVISTLASEGVLVVVSAGNEGGPVDSPANCPGAMGVAGIRHAGTKVGYSSLGPEVAIAAPAGNCVDLTGAACTFSIDTTTNSGTTTPSTNTYTDKTNMNRNIGTSFSAPIVTGIAGLMLGVNSHLQATQLIARIKQSAIPFPTSSENAGIPTCQTPTGLPNDPDKTECVCTTALCGAGMANALGAVNAALRPIADIVVQGPVTAGASLTLQGNGSVAADGHTISSFQWIKGGTTISSGPTANVVAPNSGNSTVCLVVTDDAGKTDSAKVTISASSSTVVSLDPNSNACIVEVTVTASDASAAETGDTGTFTLTRGGDATAALAVTIGLSGSAVNGTDYQTIASTVNFAAGASTATVTVTPIDNSVASGSNKTATLTIQSGSGYSAGSPGSATVTITENDVAQAPQTNAPSGGGGGGGGAMDALTVVGLALAVLAMLATSGRVPRGAQQLREDLAAKQRRPRR
jgi:serine protease